MTPRSKVRAHLLLSVIVLDVAKHSYVTQNQPNMDWTLNIFDFNTLWGGFYICWLRWGKRVTGTGLTAKGSPRWSLPLVDSIIGQFAQWLVDKKETRNKWPNGRTHTPSETCFLHDCVADNRCLFPFLLALGSSLPVLCFGEVLLQ